MASLICAHGWTTKAKRDFADGRGIRCYQGNGARKYTRREIDVLTSVAFDIRNLKEVILKQMLKDFSMMS